MWDRIKRFFRDSETIAWARLQVLLGVAAAALTYVDPALVSGVLPEKAVPIWLLASGLATEYLRRRRADDL